MRFAAISVCVVLALAGCGGSSAAPCGDVAPVAAYGDPLPPYDDPVWYPADPGEPIVGVGDPNGDPGDPGWDTPDDPGTGGDGWDDPDPQAYEGRPLHEGCYACQLVCVDHEHPLTTVGGSNRSYHDACRAAARRLVETANVKSCFTLAGSERKFRASLASGDRIPKGP